LDDVGAAFFPFWVCVFIQALTALVFVQSVLNARGEGAAAADDGVPMSKRVVLLAGILALLFAYIVAMEMVGFVASSTAFLVLVHQLLIFSETGRPSPPKGLAIATAFFAVAAGSLYFVFNTVFQLALP
ncbi:MAG: tripartite tricarboxylate transporter TctB family protein, partial [Rhodospirillales bacterium]|nr:tripartite tricarboxylate transporter TctB family protein [Rhodospirillales bacterium]